MFLLFEYYEYFTAVFVSFPRINMAERKIVIE